MNHSGAATERRPPSPSASSLARPFLLAAAGGVLHFLGFVGFGIWPLALICLVPLWLALDETRDAAARGGAGRLRLRLGLLRRRLPLAVAHRRRLPRRQRAARRRGLARRLVLVCAALRALRGALSPATAARLAGGGRRRAVAAGWSSGSTRCCSRSTSATPWPSGSTLIQIADLGGPLLLTALVALVQRRGLRDLALAGAAGARGRSRSGRCAGARAQRAGVGATARCASRRSNASVAAAPALRVGIVQGNLGVQEKGAEAGARPPPLPRADARAARRRRASTWWSGRRPSTRAACADRCRSPASSSARTCACRCSSAPPSSRGDSGRRLAYNAALLIDADGVIRSGYDKNLLIPFTEYVPFAERRAVARRAVRRRLATSPPPATTPPLSLGPWRIATPICYEAVRPAFVRRMVRAAPAASDRHARQRRVVRRFAGAVAAPGDGGAARRRASPLPGARHQQRRQRGDRSGGPRDRAQRAAHAREPARHRAPARGTHTSTRAGATGRVWLAAAVVVLAAGINYRPRTNVQGPRSAPRP